MDNLAADSIRSEERMEMTRAELRSCIRWEINNLKMLKWVKGYPSTHKDILQGWSNIRYYRSQGSQKANVH